MAQTIQGTVTVEFVNNSTMPTTVNKTVEMMVVNSRLVPDFREVNAGVTAPVFRQAQG